MLIIFYNVFSPIKQEDEIPELYHQDRHFIRQFCTKWQKHFDNLAALNNIYESGKILQALMH